MRMSLYESDDVVDASVRDGIQPSLGGHGALRPGATLAPIAPMILLAARIGKAPCPGGTVVHNGDAE
jgi:hypothetical protein